jgi:hypothetical protein
VPKVRFCAGGGFFLQPEYVKLLAHMDEHFVPFPLPENIQFHKKDGCFENLRVFDDMEVGLALQSRGIVARDEPDLKRIARW